MSKADTVISIFESALLHDRVVQERARNEYRPGGKTNPYITDAGDECERRVWYTLRQYPVTEPYTTDSLANFLLGKSAEEGFARVLEQYGVELIREVRVELEVAGSLVTGRSDFLLFFQELEAIIEMKTTTRRALKMHGWQPYDSHRSQLNLYLEASQRGLLERPTEGLSEALRATETADRLVASTGVLFYYIKDATKRQKSFYAFDVPWDHTLAMTDLQRLVAIQSAARTYPEMVPPRPAGVDPDKYPCSYCSFKTGCWSRNWTVLTPRG